MSQFATSRRELVICLYLELLNFRKLAPHALKGRMAPRSLGNLLIQSFLRYYQHMTFIAQRGGEDIGFAAIFQLQTLAQFRYRKGEVAGGDVRLGDS